MVIAGRLTVMSLVALIPSRFNGSRINSRSNNKSGGSGNNEFSINDEDRTIDLDLLRNFPASLSQENKHQ